MRLPHPCFRPVSRETRARLETISRLLSAWNRHINLVGPGTANDWWERHFKDSLQLHALLPEETGSFGDLGSGAGFPGLVLAAADPRPFHLVESDQRKAAFLREAVREAGLINVEVHPCRIEDARLPPLLAVTARALAPLPELLGHAFRVLLPSGSAIFPKGRTGELELTTATSRWHMNIERFASRTDPEATIFRFRDIHPA